MKIRKLTALLLSMIMALSLITTIPQAVSADSNAREEAVAYMNAMATISWRTSSTPISYWTGSAKFNANTVWRGLPYTMGNGRESNLEIFQSKLSNGVYVGATNTNYTGTDCSSSVAAAWKHSGAYGGFGYTGGMYPSSNSSMLQVGSYSEAAAGVNGTLSITTSNGAAVMFAAYAKLQPGDAIFKRYYTNTSYGHTCLVTSVNPSAQWITVTDQRGINAGDNPNTTWCVNRKVTFATLYNEYYIPVTTAAIRADTTFNGTQTNAASYINRIDLPASAGGTNQTVAVKAAITQGQTLKIQGWSVHSAGIKRFEYALNPTATASYGTMTGSYRKDVAAANPNYGNCDVNAYYQEINTAGINPGTLTIAVRALTKSNEYYPVASITLTIADQPKYSATVSVIGEGIAHFGGNATKATVKPGDKVNIQCTPGAHYHVGSVVVGGTAQQILNDGAEAVYSYQTPAGNVDTIVTFEKNKYATHATVSSGKGTIAYTNGVTENRAAWGTAVSFKVTPSAGYKLSSVKIGGTAQTILNSTSASSYSFTMPQGDCDVVATFVQSTAAVSNTDEEYYQSLIAKGFTDSYATRLLELHKKYPSWEFEPLLVSKLNSAYTYDYVIDKETSDPKNSLITPSSWAPAPFGGNGHGNYDAYRTGLPEYDTGWYAASKDAVRYIMDPRNFINEYDIFMFKDLKFSASSSVAAVEKALKGSFMENKTLENGRTYAQWFYEIGKCYGIDPCHLAARVLQEHGTGTSPLVNGTCGNTLWQWYSEGSNSAPAGGYTRDSLTQYNGLYNFFNIGASGTGKFTVTVNGMQEAQTGTPALATEWGGSPAWNAKYKALQGGAVKVAGLYINVYQNTLYLQKYNVDPHSGNNFWGQYMQNIAAPLTEGRTLRKAAENNGTIRDTQVFQIPVYSGMSAEPALDPKLGSSYYSPSSSCKTAANTSLYKINTNVESGSGIVHFGNNNTAEQYATYGTTVNFQVDPSAGTKVSEIRINGKCQQILNNGESAVYQFKMPTNDVMIRVKFDGQTYAVKAVAGANGTLHFGGGKTAATVGAGTVVNVQATPNVGYHTTSVSYNGTAIALKNGGADEVLSFKMPAKAVTVTSTYAPNTFSFKYYSNGGTGTMADTKVTFGVATKLATPTFTKPGYTVCGWYAYRVSDGKWLYRNSKTAEGAWCTFNEEPAGYVLSGYSINSQPAMTTGVNNDVIRLFAAWKAINSYVSTIDLPASASANNAVVKSSATTSKGNVLKIQGWSVHSSNIQRFEYAINPTAKSTYGIMKSSFRQDVATANPNYSYCKINAFSQDIDTSILGVGTTTIAVRALTGDNTYYNVATITVNVTAATTKPTTTVKPTTTTTTRPAGLTLSIGSVKANSGRQVSVPVAISGNTGISGLKFTVDYDHTALELVDVELCNGLFGSTDEVTLGDIGATHFIYTGYSGSALANNYKNGTIINLIFSVKPTAKSGNYAVKFINKDADDIFDVNAKNKTTYYVDGVISYTASNNSKSTIGDVNADGKINGKDSLTLKQYNAGIVTSIDTIAADINHDSKVNGKDVLVLKKYLSGIITVLG